MENGAQTNGCSCSLENSDNLTPVSDYQRLARCSSNIPPRVDMQFANRDRLHGASNVSHHILASIPLESLSQCSNPTTRAWSTHWPPLSTLIGQGFFSPAPSLCSLRALRLTSGHLSLASMDHSIGQRVNIRKTLLAPDFDDDARLIAHLLNQLDLTPERQGKVHAVLLSSAPLPSGQAPINLRFVLHGRNSRVRHKVSLTRRGRQGLETGRPRVSSVAERRVELRGFAHQGRNPATTRRPTRCQNRTVRKQRRPMVSRGGCCSRTLGQACSSPFASFHGVLRQQTNKRKSARKDGNPPTAEHRTLCRCLAD